MTDRHEHLLREAMNGIAPSGIHFGCRAIQADDASLLLDEEQRAITTRNPDARRASGAARHSARVLMTALGYPHAVVGRMQSGAPVWPAGIKGSLAHDEQMAVAAISSDLGIASLRIDVEVAESLPDDVASLVITSSDKFGSFGNLLAGRAVFAAKEAVYKATYPLDGVILGYDDIAIDFEAATGETRTGHVARLYWCAAPRLVVLAVMHNGT